MDFYYKCSSRIESTKALQFYQQVQSTQFNLALSSWICYLCLYFNSKCNWINWVPTKELQHQETQNNLHYQPHTETKSTRSDSSEVLLRSLMDVLWNAESTAWLVLPWATIIWILGPSFTLWCEGSAHTPSCLHKQDYMCRLRASTEIWISHRPELHLWAPHSKLLPTCSVNYWQSSLAVTRPN